MNVILVVEDEQTVRENLCDLLMMKDYQVLYAGNGVEALDVLKNFKVDLIITDIMMPVMDGIEFLNKLKENEDLKTIPVMFFLQSPKVQYYSSVYKTW